jgi:TupA-like ATPgrasp
MFQGELTTLRRPTTYSQMLAAKNLRDHDPLVSLTSDKYAVREYVREKVGADYLIPLQQVVDRADAIDFGEVSGSCVIKGTHGCDMTLLVPDVATADRAAIRATVQKWLDTDFYRSGWREAPYRGLPRRAVVEEFIGDGVHAPNDYKFFMFHGRPAMVVVDQDRFTRHTSTLLSPDWRPYRVTGRFEFAAALPEQPANYAEMVGVAQKLSSDFDFARVDLYNVDGRIYFGEITHNPGGGLVRLQPRAFDLALGELWRNGTPVPSRFVRT